MRLILVLLLALVFAFPPFPGHAATKDAELLKVVVLSRHGVRSPTQSEKRLASWTQKTWPQWPVARGELTPRGAQLAKAMWSNIRRMFDDWNLMARGACPKVYVRADVDERTQATARAILDGVSPGCNLPYEVTSRKIDPLFHPVRAGLFRYDAIAVATDVLARTHGGLNRLLDEFSGSMKLMDRINGSPSPALCSRFALMPNCQLTDLPNAISVAADSSSINLVGALGVCSSLAEIFLLEYAQWPNELPGWGQVNEQILGQLLPVHAKVFDVVNRANVVAWANGSALLREMARALLSEHSEPAINDAHLVVFVGHDTNIANVAGLLSLNWRLPGYPANGIPPAGAFFLELWRDNGVLKVIPRFYSQPLATLHRPLVEPLNAEALRDFEPRSVHMSGVQELTYYSPAEFRILVERVTADAPSPEPETLREKTVILDKAS